MERQLQKISCMSGMQHQEVTWPQQWQRLCPLWVLVLFEAKFLKWYRVGAELRGHTLWSTDNFPLLLHAAVRHPVLACHCTKMHSQARGKARTDIRVISDATYDGKDIYPFNLSSDYFKFLLCFNSFFFSFLSIDTLMLFLVYMCCRYCKKSLLFFSGTTALGNGWMGLGSILPIYTSTWLLFDNAQMNIINLCQRTHLNCWPSCLSYHSWDLDELMLELILPIAWNLMPSQALIKSYQHHV